MSGPCVIIGGGLVGMALANGLAEAGQEVLVLDDGDHAFRASRGNAGLVWVQGKGDHLAAYADWTRRSASLWPGFAILLREATGIDVEYSRPGGFHLCLGERELAARAAICTAMARRGDGSGMAMIDRATLKRQIPLIGEAVAGASWCAEDGYANPLALLRALHARAAALGVTYRSDEPVRLIRSARQGFAIETASRQLHAARLVLAAGLANATLGPMVGMTVPVRPVRGQIVVTERQARFLDHPTSTIRQNANGTVMFGNSVERDAGFDTSTSLAVTARHARRALLEFPHLAGARVVRSWAALRVMPSDELPIYQESATSPGAFVATCHSGVTLAAVHACVLGPAIARGMLPAECTSFTTERFRAASPHAA